MPEIIITFVGWFVRLAGKEAYDAYKRKKADERAAKVRAKEQASARTAARLAAEEAAERAMKKAKYMDQLATIDEATRSLKQAEHRAEMRAEADAHPIDPNPYE